MKKKVIVILLILVVVITVFIFAISNKNTNENQNEDKNTKVSEIGERGKEISILENVLNSKKEFITNEEGKAFLKDFTSYGNVIKYAFVDMNIDGEDEMIVELDGKDEMCILFHYDGSDVYGYAINRSRLSEIKTDGTYSTTETGAVSGVCQMEFDDNEHQYIETKVASNDNGNYTLYGKVATQTEYDELISNQNSKQDIVWNDFK